MSAKYIYADNWNEIARACKDAVHWRCTKCGVWHNQQIKRSSLTPSEYQWYDEGLRLWRDKDGRLLKPDEVWQCPVVRVELSVHHAGVPYSDGTPGDPDDKMDNRPENLQVLCARCHLLAELDISFKKRANRRQKQIRDSGQLVMFMLGADEAGS